MLRANQIITDLGIPQARIVEATGWSKAQISISLRTGAMPVDAERFKASLRKWAEGHPEVLRWLNDRGLGVGNLTDVVGLPPADLGEAIHSVVTRCAIGGPRTDDVNNLAKVCLYLLDELRDVLADEDLEIIKTTAAGRLL